MTAEIPPTDDFLRWFRELNDFEVGDGKMYYGGPVTAEELKNAASAEVRQPEPGWVNLGPAE